MCGRCGYQLVVGYNNAHSGLRYNCHKALTCYGGPVCQSLSGRRLDAFVTEQVLAALQPAALELHLAAAQDVEQRLPLAIDVPLPRSFHLARRQRPVDPLDLRLLPPVPQQPARRPVNPRVGIVTVQRQEARGQRLLLRRQ